MADKLHKLLDPGRSGHRESPAKQNASSQTSIKIISDAENGDLIERQFKLNRRKKEAKKQALTA